MNKIEVLNTYLLAVQFAFEKPDIKKLMVTVMDTVTTEEIDNEIVKLRVERTLDFGEETNCYIAVAFHMTIKGSEEWNEEKVQAFCSSDIPGLREVYAKISLLISEISNASPFGLVITPPTYLNQK